MINQPFNRRQFNQCSLGVAAASALPIFSSENAAIAEETDFKFRYIVGSSMYGYTDVAEILK